MSRLIFANLDCELHYARTHCPGPIKELPKGVRQAVARASLALDVFAAEGDALWTLAALEPRSTRAQLLSGPLARQGPFEAVLAWGQTEEVPAARGVSEPALCWQDKLFAQPRCWEAAGLCNDRRFAMAVPVPLEWSLPEVETVSTLDELDRYLSTKTLGPEEGWVAKAPFSASGRERVRRHGRALQGEERVRASRLLERYGQLVVEPWMPRTADFGCAGIVEDTKLQIFPMHRLLSDNTGVFRGIRIADRETEEALGRDFRQAIFQSAQAAGAALQEAGYRGPFGIDCFEYRDARGGLRLNSLCEINARMCFGLVARAHAERSGREEFDFTL